MKRLIASVSLSLALAIGTTACAHQQLTKPRVAETAAAVAVIAGPFILAANANCANCNIAVENPAALPQPPR